MIENLYLILHKVRGQPAFDIAERCDELGTPVDPGPWWIIPTSGHRAYPYQSWPLTNLWLNREYVPTLVDIPAGFPDHYSAASYRRPKQPQREAPSRHTQSVDSLLEGL